MVYILLFARERKRKKLHTAEVASKEAENPGANAPLLKWLRCDEKDAAAWIQ